MSISNAELLEVIRQYGENFDKVRSQDAWYKIRCPFCGDSDNPRHAHCYIHCDVNSNERVVWHCMRCPGKNTGLVNRKFLELIGVTDSSILKGVAGSARVNRIEVKYLQHRLGDFNSEDVSRFKILWDLSVVPPLVRRRDGSMPFNLPTNMDSITFLSHDNGMMITRGFRPEDVWVKRKIRNSRGFYVIKTELDLFTSEPIYVSVCEGIMDTLSAYRNFREDGYNLFISALGSDYIPAVEYVIKMGVVGKNVHVRVYMDTDRNEEFLTDQLRFYKLVFGSISIRKNTKFKDIGVPISMIRIVDRKVR